VLQIIPKQHCSLGGSKGWAEMKKKEEEKERKKIRFYFL